MNDRIRELAKDAELDWHKHWSDDESNRLEKFAELIVRECACVPTDMWGEGQLPAEWAGKVQQRILKHFGVE